MIPTERRCGNDIPGRSGQPAQPNGGPAV